jgi:hypothetical protein
MNKRILNKKTGHDDDTAIEENENISMRLPLKSAHITKLGFKKSNTGNKKLIKVNAFTQNNKKSLSDRNKKKSITKRDMSDSDESCSDDSCSSDEELPKRGKSSKCTGCSSRDAKIKTMQSQISDLKKDVKTTNKIIPKERKSILSQMNFVDFSNGKKWSPSTKIGCLWDGQLFKTSPCPMPLRFYKNTYYVYGCFCSVNCVLAQIINMGGPNMSERVSLLHKMYRDMHGYCVKIKQSDPPTVLTIYGGKKSIDEYRSDNLIIEKECRVTLPPLAPLIPVIEYDYNDDNKINSANITLAKANKKIRLKRTKPLVNRTGLAKSMGLKIKAKSKTANEC